MFTNLQTALFITKLTQKEIAEMIRITPTSFSRKMQNKSDFNLSEMIQIQNIINTKSNKKYTLDYLFEK